MLPSYTGPWMNRNITVKLQNLGPGQEEVGGFLSKSPFGRSVTINQGQGELARVVLDELAERNLYVPSSYSAEGSQWMGDVLGHEMTHALQPVNNRPYPRANVEGPRAYVQGPEELPAWFSTLKYWYYSRTGKLLPANMTEGDINNFIQYYHRNKGGYFRGNTRMYDHAVETLSTPEGRALFRQIVSLGCDFSKFS